MVESTTWQDRASIPGLVFITQWLPQWIDQSIRDGCPWDPNTSRRSDLQMLLTWIWGLSFQHMKSGRHSEAIAGPWVVFSRCMKDYTICRVRVHTSNFRAGDSVHQREIPTPITAPTFQSPARFTAVAFRDNQDCVCCAVPSTSNCNPPQASPVSDFQWTT
jgi:hypothetical protein